MFEEGPTACTRCGGELRRVFHPTGIIFKGGGFYKTDSRVSSSSSSVGDAGRDGSGGSGDTSAPAASATETKTSDAGSTPKSSGGAANGGGGSD